MGALLNCHLGLLAFLLSTQLVAPDTRTCTSGWVRDCNSCYRFAQAEYLLWGGEGFCQDLRAGAHLASILSKEEAQFVSTFLKEQKIQGAVQIGLQPQVNDQNKIEWTWTDGSPFQYEAWMSDESHNKSPFTSQCVVLTEESNYTLWEQTGCLYPLIHGICKYRL